jgi:hypothetical protein
VDWLPGEDEVLQEIRADEYEACLDALADEIEPFALHMETIEGMSEQNASDE